MIPHSVVMRAVLTCPGMLSTLQGHPPAATGIDPLSNSDLGVEPALFGSLINGGEFLLHSIFFSFTLLFEACVLHHPGPVKSV